MLLFLLIYRMESWIIPFRWLFLFLTIMTSTIGVFVASPPDNYTAAYAPERNLQLDVFDEMLNNAPLDSLQLREGKQVICFFSTGCEYCQMAARKLSLVQQFYGFPAENITYIFMGNREGIVRFYEQSESAQYRDVLYPDAVRLLKAINGALPTIVFLKDGEVVHEYGFRNMNEEEMKAFFAE